MNIMFLLALSLRNNSIVDIFWGPGFLIIAFFSAFPFDALNTTKITFGILLAAWSLRLSLHIFMRNKGHGEDFRYAEWRKTWKHFIFRSYFQVFMLQGLVMLIVSLPVIIIFNSDFTGSPIYTFIGFIVFATGFGMETLADYQLQQFRNNPLNKGHIIRSGLWKWSRHPNYLGEAMLWFGLWIISIPCSYWFVTILSPITITLLLRYVSGVPMMEEKFRNHPEWDEYSAKTPVFLPWFR